MHKPPYTTKLIIKIEIFVLLLCMVFADRHGAIFFEYQQWFRSYELLKVTIIQHMKLRKRHLQVFSILTCPDFQKEAPVQTCVRC